MLVFNMPIACNGHSGNSNPQHERKGNVLTIRYHIFNYLETQRHLGKDYRQKTHPNKQKTPQNKRQPPNLYYLCARGEQTLFPKPVILPRTSSFTRSQHRPNTLGTPKIKRSMPKAIYKSLKPIFKRYFNLFIGTCNDYCSFNIKKSVLFSSNGNNLWHVQLLQWFNIYMCI